MFVQPGQDQPGEQDRCRHRPVQIAREIDRRAADFDHARAQRHRQIGSGRDKGDKGMKLGVVAELAPFIAVKEDRHATK